MQLSPRQYQVDPTGSSYVADTRPLMAAMGAQAATQIEGNRMMQETVQRGMKGVEDFAARRQLAAARAQLGELNINDPDYGQKLSGLVMDNPLAFTNEKTAGVANFAFKQASESYLAKEKNKADSLARYQEYRYGIDAINAKMQGQSSLIDKEYSRMAADTFRAESSAAVADIKRIDQAILENKDSRHLPFLQSEKARAASAFTGVKKKYEDTVNRTRQPNVASYSGPMEYAPLPEDGGVPMDGAIVSPNLFDQQNLDASLIPNAIEGPNTPPFLPDYENRPPLMSAISSEKSRSAVAPISPSDIQYGEPMPSVDAPVIPAAPVTPAGAVAPSVAQTSGVYTSEQIAESRRAYEESLREPSSTSRAGKMTQSSIDALVRVTPSVNQAQVEYDDIDTQLKILDNQIKEAADFSADTTKFKADRESLLKALPAAKNKLELFKAAAELKLSEFGTAQEALDFLRTEEAIQQDKLKRAAPAAAAPAAGAGTTTTTPKPPAPPVGVDPLEQVAIDREFKRKEEQGLLAPETNKQWTDTKQKVANILGGPQELMKIADDVFENNFFGISLPADETRLRAQLKLKIINKAGNIVGFNQKAERLGSQTVSRSDVIEALVDDIIRARKSGISAVEAAALAPSSVSADGKTGTLSKP